MKPSPNRVSLRFAGGPGAFSLDKLPRYIHDKPDLARLMHDMNVIMYELAVRKPEGFGRAYDRIQVTQIDNVDAAARNRKPYRAEHTRRYIDQALEALVGGPPDIIRMLKKLRAEA